MTEEEIANIKFFEIVLTESEVRWLIEHLRWFKDATRGSHNLCNDEEEPLVTRLLVIFTNQIPELKKE